MVTNSMKKIDVFGKNFNLQNTLRLRVCLFRLDKTHLIPI